MGNKEIEYQRTEIDNKLKGLINGNYIYADAPYYGNIGDIFIWQGFMDFQKSLPGRFLRCASVATFDFPRIDKNTTIILTGGGNFGDLYRYYHEFRLKVITNYPNNKIIILPQSIHYEDKRYIFQDYNVLKGHKNLYLCLRDKFSYDFAKQNFPLINLLLVPDFAFYINDKLLNKYKQIYSKDKTLYFLRKDSELADSPLISNSDVIDWPTIERVYFRFKFLDILYRISNKLPTVLRRFFNRSIDIIADNIIRKALVSKGFEVLASYQKIVSTRLHAFIGGLLLDKDTSYIDNSTKKISAYVQTWLKDTQHKLKYDHVNN